MAIGSGYIRGRRTKAVSAVCLYVACRMDDQNTTMLIDFADVLQVSSGPSHFPNNAMLTIA